MLMQGSLGFVLSLQWDTHSDVITLASSIAPFCRRIQTAAEAGWARGKNAHSMCSLSQLSTVANPHLKFVNRFLKTATLK